MAVLVVGAGGWRRWRWRSAGAPGRRRVGVLVALGWIELIDATTYLNHYWFLTLVAALGRGGAAGRGR